MQPLTHDNIDNANTDLKIRMFAAYLLNWDEDNYHSSDTNWDHWHTKNGSVVRRSEGIFHTSVDSQKEALDKLIARGWCLQVRSPIIQVKPPIVPHEHYECVMFRGKDIVTDYNQAKPCPQYTAITEAEARMTVMLHAAAEDIARPA